MNHLKKIFIFLFLLLVLCGASQVKLCSWNLQNFGKSKTDSTIHFIATTLKDFDVVAIVEVVAGPGGAEAVARLADALGRKGSHWDYCISDPTSGSPYRQERYAFLWKTNKVKLKGKAWLEKKYESEIEREPYFADFVAEEKEFTIACFHALPKNKQPETEIKYFKFLPTEYPKKNILFCGDFNCPESHAVFNPLKSMLYAPVLTRQKTSLKRECVNTNCLASEYDNIFYNTKAVTAIQSGVIHFYKNFPTLHRARVVSDHIPVYFEFTVN